MQVYRLCKEKEIKNIIHYSSFKKVGKEYNINNNINTHKYKKHIKYLHFFKNKDSIFFFSTEIGKYICTYEIPDELLNICSGCGYYFDSISFSFKEKAQEFAIPTCLLSFNYLIKVERITNDLDIFDYLDNNGEKSLVTVYENEINNEQNNEKLIKRLIKKVMH